LESGRFSDDNGAIPMTQGEQLVKQTISKWLTGAAAGGLAVGVLAAPFSVTYTDTVNFTDLPAEVLLGQQATIKLILDNGNSTAANQTWSAANLKCIIFTFNNVQNKSVTIDYSASPLSPGPSTFISGNFTTNGAGQLQAGTINWNDYREPIPNPHVTNIAGVTLVNDWFIDSVNNVLFLDSAEIGFANVAKDGPVTNWSNPVPSGVCGAAPPPPPATSQAVPTMSEWGLFMISGLLALSTVFARRRQRK
jgi:hypothetical protein